MPPDRRRGPAGRQRAEGQGGRPTLGQGVPAGGRQASLHGLYRAAGGGAGGRAGLRASGSGAAGVRAPAPSPLGQEGDRRRDDITGQRRLDQPVRLLPGRCGRHGGGRDRLPRSAPGRGGRGRLRRRAAGPAPGGGEQVAASLARHSGGVAGSEGRVRPDHGRQRGIPAGDARSGDEAGRADPDFLHFEVELVPEREQGRAESQSHPTRSESSVAPRRGRSRSRIGRSRSRIRLAGPAGIPPGRPPRARSSA